MANIPGTPGNDNLVGTADDDTITGEAGNDSLLGLGGDDLLDGGEGNDTLEGGAGNDTLIGGAGADVLDGGAGLADVVDYSGSNVGVQVLAGVGFGGDAEGDNISNVEHVIGSDFDDRFLGEDQPLGSFSETLEGGDGDDTIDARGGNDSVSGGAGNDALVGGVGDHTIDGGDGNDIIFDTEGNDSLSAGDGNDTVFAGDGNDTVDGGDGDDLISGGDGVDTIFGGAGNDTVQAGSGNDTVTGGAGEDVYDIDANFGEDSYLDFTLNEDLFNVSDIPSEAPDFLGMTVRPGEIVVTSNPPDADFPGGSQTLLFPDGSTAIVPAGTIRTDTRRNQIDDLVTAGISCFTRGTLISTLKGDVPIETLEPGDKVITRKYGATTLRWIGSRKVPAIGNFAPVMIKAGALGNHSDLLVSPQHRMLILDERAELMFGSNEVLAAAKHLVNGETIFFVEGGEVEYWHILFDEHQVVYSNGAMSESFHPGDQAMSDLEQGAREEILELFPELEGRSATGYGQTAELVLKRWQVQALFPETSAAAASQATPQPTSHALH